MDVMAYIEAAGNKAWEVDGLAPDAPLRET